MLLYTKLIYTNVELSWATNLRVKYSSESCPRKDQSGERQDNLDRRLPAFQVWGWATLAKELLI